MLRSWERERSSERRSSSVWWRLERVERYVEGEKEGERKSERERGAAKGRVFGSSSSSEEVGSEEVFERESLIWVCC